MISLPKLSLLTALLLLGTALVTHADLSESDVRTMLLESMGPRELTEEAAWKRAESVYNKLVSYGQNAAPALIAIVQSDTEASRNRAVGIRALGDIRSSRSLPLLRQCLTSRDDGIRSEAISALAKIGGETAVMALCEVVAKDGIFDAGWAERALASIAGTNSTESLAAHLSDHNLTIVYAVQESLSRIPSETAAEKLAASLSDGRVGVRHGAAELLGHRNSASALQRLQQAFGKETEPLVRIEIAASMVSLGETNVSLKSLQEYAQGGDVDDRCRAIAALARVKNAKSVKILRDLLKEHEPLVRMNAVEVLAKIGDKTVWVDIQKIAEHDEWGQLREVAHDLLEHIDASNPDHSQ